MPYPDNSGYLNVGNWIGNSTLFSNMLSGHHAIGIIKADWNFSYANTTRTTPTNYGLGFMNGNPFLGASGLGGEAWSDWIDHSTISNDTMSYLSILTSRNENISESSLTGGLNLEIPFSIGNDISVSLKFGGKYNVLDRDQENFLHKQAHYDLGVQNVKAWDPEYPYPYYLHPDNRILLKTYTDQGYTPNSDFLGGEYTFDNPVDRGMTDNWHDYFRDLLTEDLSTAVDNVYLTESILAGYAMANIKYKNLLTVIAGMRVEKSDNSYDSRISSLSGDDNQFGNIRDTITYQEYTDYLPHLHIKFEPAKWYTLRFSAAQTLARPDYNYISYNAYIDKQFKRISSGNPRLKHMTSMNYDLNMSFYNGKYGLFSIGGFYKKMENIFYRSSCLYLNSDSLATAAGWPGKVGFELNSYANSPEAEAYGIETEGAIPFCGTIYAAHFK